ncbi:MAG: tetratricopeptide repeat protein [bacterium]|nr:tetratricopeptide repeat protein [bacterium]
MKHTTIEHRLPRRGLRVPALICLLAMTCVADAQPRPKLEGFAELFSIERLTVVYPAGDPANRVSAERRAAYLEAEYGVQPSVVADGAVSPEQLGGHLLLLGWDNAILDRLEPGIERSAEGRNFLEISVPPQRDLAFAAPSPFHETARLFFWSRIDLELDRFSVIPFAGSDWAVYEDYLPTSQGMFTKRSVWPPARNHGAESPETAAELPPEQARSEHFTLHAPAGIVDGEKAREILEARERALELALKKLGDPGEGFRIRLAVYETARLKEKATGVPDAIHSVPRLRTQHTVLRSAETASPYEELRLVAGARFGPCVSTALYEGLAIALAPAPQGRELPVYAALLQDRDALPAIGDLFDEEQHRSLSRQGVGYAASGLLVDWILETRGIEALARAYVLSPPTAAGLAQALGDPELDVDRAFDRWSARLARRSKGELAFQRAVAEAREATRAGKHETAGNKLEQALKMRPDDPEVLYKLGLARMKHDDEAALAAFGRLVELETPADKAHFVLFGHYQMGQVLGRSRRVDEARACHQRVLDLPDRYDAHRMAREALEALDGD